MTIKQLSKYEYELTGGKHDYYIECAGDNDFWTAVAWESSENDSNKAFVMMNEFETLVDALSDVFEFENSRAKQLGG
jgi:hypothetical protein